MPTESPVTYRAEYNGADIGTIVVENDAVTFKLAHPWQLEAAGILERLKKEGVRDLGEVRLKKPLALETEQIFPELWRELAGRGVVLKKGE
jgi:hypothetical protein